MDPKHLTPGDATLIENIVSYLKAKGIFDEFRHECLADVDTKSSCQNLSQRVDGYTSKYLANETWHPDLNKNELRNNLRQHILQSSFLAPGTDIVVEQVITAKLYNYFLPKIIEVVHGYVQEQSELVNKKPEPSTSTKSSLTSEKPVTDTAENKDKIQISDPIADILCFIHPKTESIQHKDGDTLKMEKTKEEKNIPPVQGEAITPVNEAKVQPKKEKDKIRKEDSKIQQENLKKVSDVQGDTTSISINEAKLPTEKEKDKIKKEDVKIQQEVLKKTIKEEIKSEKKKIDDVKVSVSEIATTSEESKSNVVVPSKPNISSKKDDKNKHKPKSQNVQKSSSSSSEIKKSKKDSSEKPYDKLNKSRPTKSPKESHSPTKLSSSQKSVFKEECPKTKSDVSSNKIPESLGKKSKSSCDKKDSSSSKHKGYNEKTDKPKISKSVDKNEPHIHPDSSNSEKSSKNVQYSSSYDSSQGSDQEKNTSTSSKKERTKHFSKHASKEKSELPDNSNKVDKKRSNSEDESPTKKYRNEKDAKLKSKDISVIEAAKICSRSNSFGSTSSIGSSSNASKDNLISNSDEASENSVKDKKKKQLKEKDSCQSSPKTLPPPPPPPPPPSSSLTSELTSSAEMSSMEDTQSSMDDSETSSSEEVSEESSSESELESKDLINDTLNENTLNSSNDNINAFYDIFLYSSSSSEFEGYGNSPEKKNVLENIFENMHESDLSISSVHTSDLSSFEDELSSDDEVAVLTGGLKKRLTLKEAQELIKNKAVLNEKRKVESESHVGEDLINKKCLERSSSFVSSDDESSPSEPKRLLRRERKLNPRYSSSEYTSIFNCKKETFITKQTSPVKSQTFSPKTEPKLKKADSFKENNKLIKGSLKEAKNIEIPSNEILDKNEIKFKEELKDEDDNSSDELDSFMDKEKLFKENNKNNLISDNDKLKDEKKLKPYNNSKSRRNSHSLKRKLEVTESTPVKRPCSRSSVDSSSSEFAPNENKPFNSEKNDFHEEKKFNDCSLKVSNLTIGVKKDLFCKQKTNNNGDILGQKNSHSNVISNSEKKDK